MRGTRPGRVPTSSPFSTMVSPFTSTRTMPSGRTLWAELVARYDRGVATVDDLGRRWAALKPDIDPQRHAEVTAYLAVQAREARWWRDACIAYFQSVSGLPLPAGVRPPEQDLQAYKALRFDFAPGR